MRSSAREVGRFGGCRGSLLTVALLAVFAAGVATVARAQDAAPVGDADAALRKALESPGWVELPKSITEVRHSGPTPAGLGPLWYLTRPPGPNSRPHLSEGQEQAFARSVEAAHAGRTRLIEGGEVLLVDPDERVWAVADHMPHVLRCYDGKAWAYRRADGLPADADEPGAFARLAREGKLPKSDYAPGGLRDLNDLGRWYPAACADAAGNLHFVASCVSADAERRGAGGGGVHTRRPDGTWSVFRIYPGDLPPSKMSLDGLRCMVHAAAAAGEVPDGKPVDAAPAAAAPRDLVTIADFRLSDPVAASHGHKVLPIPAGAGQLWHQRWADHTAEPRQGPRYFLRFDGTNWRFDRSAIGFGVYDAVFSAWPQADGTIYLANRFGLWVQWPRDVASSTATRDRMIGALLDAAEGPDTKVAEGALAAMGASVLDALTEAVGQASTDRARARLESARAEAARVAAGAENAAPVLGGRWRFVGTVLPQATMPDGRFAFHCERAIDVPANRELADCVVVFDPAAGAFDVRQIDRGQWRAAGFPRAEAGRAPMNSSAGTVIDGDGGLWVGDGYRLGRDGLVTRVVPAGLKLDLPRAVDDAGRVYFRIDAPNQLSLASYRPGGPAGAAVVPEAPKGPAVEAGGDEIHVERVRALFSQPDVPPPWSGWAIQERDLDQGDLLLRLGGPAPTHVEPPAELKRVGSVVPLDGGCVAASREAAGFWDGTEWDVAASVKELVERHGPRLAKMTPSYAFAADTSLARHGHVELHLFLAGDGRGGLWLAEDARGERAIWHWDAAAGFTDVAKLLPQPLARAEDGAFATAERGRALIVQMEQDGARPGGYWAVWRVTPEDVKGGDTVPQAVRRPGLHVTLMAALGPNTIFSRDLWVDRKGWVWSPIFSEGAGRWVRRRDARVGHTPLPSHAVGGFVQPADGPAWCLTGKMRDTPMVWADVSPVGEAPKEYPRETWVGAPVAGMGAGARLALGPGGRVYLLHEGGCSLLRLQKLDAGARPQGPMSVMRTSQRPRTVEEMDALMEAVRARRTAQTRPATGPATSPAGAATRPTSRRAGDDAAGPGWEIREAARLDWARPRNDFKRVAFDETGVWVLPEGGPLMRTPLPKE